MAFNGRFVLNVAHYAAKVGGNLDSLIKSTGFTEAELCDENCVLDNEVYNLVMETAIAETGDLAFGLHVGQSLNLTAAGLIGQMTHSADTVKQALELCCEYANLGCSSLPMTLEEHDNYYKVKLKPNPVWLAQSKMAVDQTAVGVLAFTIREFHSLTRFKHNPIQVFLTIDKPNRPEEYIAAFGCPVNFAEEELALLLEKPHVEDKIVTSDYNLLRILVAHAEEKSKELINGKGVGSLVRESILNLVKPEFPSIEMVAGHLNMSSRTLQRRLKSEGLSFKAIIDELKKEFALKYIKRDDLSIAEIAYLLNYADSSAFNRSFRRWYGKSPRAYRQA